MDKALTLTPSNSFISVDPHRPRASDHYDTKAIGIKQIPFLFLFHFKKLGIQHTYLHVN